MIKNDKIKRSENRKTRAKAAGLKSVFMIKDKLVLTSFGRGSEPILEKIIVENATNNINNPEKFKAKVDEKQIEIMGNGINDGITDRPQKIRGDAIGAKDELEKIFFGCKFEDNIRIQMIYNILDIKKIFSVYANNIIYAVDNLDKNSSEKDFDYLGMLFSGNSYEELVNVKEGDYRYSEKIKAKLRFEKYYAGAKDSFIYFGDVFYKTPSSDEVSKLKENGKRFKPGELVLKKEEEVFDILRLLGEVRQCVTHYKEPKYDIIYNSEVMKNDFKNLISSFYDERINKLNRGFIAQNGSSNLPIIFKYYGAEAEKERKELTANFYNFVVKRENKNMGFSLKKIRENMLDIQEASYLKEEEYNSIRHKLYLLMDFIIYSYYAKENKLVEEIVATLRSKLDEDDKEAVYKENAEALWKAIGASIKTKLVTQINGDSIKNIEKEDIKIDESWIKDVKISGKETKCFTKMVYFMSLFLDGKEINEFLTVLINKFENIQGFLDIMTHEAIGEKKEQPKTEKGKSLKGLESLAALIPASIDSGLKEEFKLFESSKTIADEIRIMKNFARMEKELPPFKKAQYIDAAKILGVEKNGEQNLDEYVEDIILGNAKRRTEGDKNIRNFLANNVLESSRFRYLIRYGNLEKIRKMIKHKEVVKFVLNKIYLNVPKQIDRYVFSLEKEAKFDTAEDKIDFLTSEIMQISFEKFIGVKQKSRTGSLENVDKEKKKALISLYLTIAYLMTKSLVNINSRYVIAVYNLEKDMKLIGRISLKEQEDKQKNNNGDYPEYALLTQRFISNGKMKFRNAQYMQTNLAGYSAWMFKEYRNRIAHISVLEEALKYIEDKREIKSYFELYHYIIQRSLEDKYRIGASKNYKMDVKNIITEKFELTNKYHTYNKDLLKILNVPFGYNLGRFKAISIEPLFDKDNMGESLLADTAQSVIEKEE